MRIIDAQPVTASETGKRSVETRSRVLGAGMKVPDELITNEYLATVVDTSDEWIVTRTGMKERRHVRKDQAASDLAVPASLEALKRANLTARELDMIIVATVTPDMLFPSTSCILQDRIGARQIPAFDVSAGCTGAIYALVLADQFIRTGACRHVLVVGVEVLSKITNWTDRSTCVLFGDAAGAVVVGPCSDGAHGMLASHLASNGADGDTLYMPAGGSRMPATAETVKQHLHTLHMRGNEVFKPAVNTMLESTQMLIERARLTVDDIDLFIFHQANLRIIEAVGKRLGVSDDKVFVNIHKYGNTSSASTMVAIHEALAQGRIRTGSRVIQVAFGAGLTWGGILWSW
jgi:3-oxoacyl-[acyl-carrier-protein] synthase-3